MHHWLQIVLLQPGNEKNAGSTTNLLILLLITIIITIIITTSVIETIGNSESRLAALRILIEFGTAEEKTQALAEVRSLAYRNPVTTTTVSEVASNTAADGEATSEEVAAGANNEASCTGSEDEDSDGSL